MFAVNGCTLSPASSDFQHLPHRKAWSHEASQVASPACDCKGLPCYFCLLCLPIVHKLWVTGTSTLPGPHDPCLSLRQWRVHGDLGSYDTAFRSNSLWSKGETNVLGTETQRKGTVPTHTHCLRERRHPYMYYKYTQ